MPDLRDTFIDFKVGDWAFDSYAKETVKISNCKCVLDHTNPEAYKVSHRVHVFDRGPHEFEACGCRMTACEAIALRVVGANARRPVIAFTYRQVEAKYLRKTEAVNIYQGDVIKTLHIGRV